MTIPALIPSNAVEINNGRPITTSLAVAEIFEKEHFHVLRDVRTLGCSPEFTASNFWFSDYKDSTGRTLPMVQMTKDGFTLLAMGYTGAKAMAFKVAYIQGHLRVRRSFSAVMPNLYVPPPSRLASKVAVLSLAKGS